MYFDASDLFTSSVGQMGALVVRYVLVSVIICR